MKEYVGYVIKALRTEKKMTQAQLADNICSIKHLSRLENEGGNPSIYMLTEFSKKLGHELYDFLPFITEKNAYEIKKALDHAQSLFESRKYEDLHVFLDHSEVLNNTDHVRVNQEMALLYSVVSFHKDIHMHIDEEYYIYILKQTRNFDSLEELFDTPMDVLAFKIINSIITYHLVNKNYSYAEKLLIMSIENYERYHTNMKDNVYLRFLYNLSRLYLNFNNYESAITYSKKGIDYCKKYTHSAYLPDLTSVYGRGLYKLGQEEDGQANIKLAIQLYKFYYPDLDDKFIDILIKRYKLS